MYNLDKTLISKFRKQILTEIDDKRFGLAQGGVSDITTYKEICATIQGLEGALQVFNDLVETMGKDSETE